MPTLFDLLFRGGAEPSTAQPAPPPAPSFRRLGVSPGGDPVFSFTRDGTASTGTIPTGVVNLLGGEDLAGRYFSGIADTDFPAVLADLTQQADNLARVQSGREAGRGFLDTAGTRLADLREEFTNDPIRQYVLGELQRRSGPEYSLISPEQEASLRLDQSGNVIRGAQQFQHSLAQRGLTGSGIEGSVGSMLNAIANRGGLQISANVDAQNQSARDQALASLGRFDLVSDQFLAGLAQAEGNLDLARASFESDAPVTQTDFFRGPALSEARESFERELAALDTINQQLEQETSLSASDIATRFMSAVGSGGLSNPAVGIPMAIGLFADIYDEAARRS